MTLPIPSEDKCPTCGSDVKCGNKFCSKKCASIFREDLKNPTISINGIQKKRKEWETETGITHNLVNERLKRGWLIETALTTPAIQPARSTKDNRYSVYRGMLNRCNNPNCWAFSRYGDKGVKVCDKWLGKNGFTTFCKDMGERPDGCTLDRIDNDKGYYPENCRWATPKQQANNTCKTKKLTIGSETKTLSEWCDVYGIKKPTVESRLRAGWTCSEAVMLPTYKGAHISEDDIQIALCQWLDIHDIKYWHTPNETWTSSWATKAKNKKKGVKAGVPDLTILIPYDTGFFTLYLELKTETGTMSDDQKEWQSILSEVDSCEYRCCKGLDEAIGIVENMLKNGQNLEKTEISDKKQKNDCPF